VDTTNPQKVHNKCTIHISVELPVAAIRTVTVTMAPIFRDLIVGLMAGRRDLDVVEELDTRDGLKEWLQAVAPELILIGLRKNEADEFVVPPLVRLLPNAKVIAFSSDGRHAFVHHMHQQRTELLDVSAETLIDSILRP
jgi:hypothetical protein